MLNVPNNLPRIACHVWQSIFGNVFLSDFFLCLNWIELNFSGDSIDNSSVLTGNGLPVHISYFLTVRHASKTKVEFVLIWMMGCRLVGTKPLPELTITTINYRRSNMLSRHLSPDHHQGNDYDDSRASHKAVGRLTARSREASRPRDSGLNFPNLFEIWQAPRQQRCRDACQISERHTHYNIQSRGFETLRDLAVRRLTA